MSAQEYNLITHELPTEIIDNKGQKVRLVPYAARAIDCLQILDDKAIPEPVKQDYIVSRMTYASTAQKSACMGMLATQVMDFLSGAPLPQYEKTNLPTSKEPLIYWALDSAAIVASFRQAYGLSLADIRTLHWWEFCALLYSIPSDTRLGGLFRIRSEVPDPKDPPETRKRTTEVKKGARPKDTRSREEKEADAQKAIAAAFAF